MFVHVEDVLRLIARKLNRVRHVAAGGNTSAIVTDLGDLLLLGTAWNTEGAQAPFYVPRSLFLHAAVSKVGCGQQHMLALVDFNSYRHLFACNNHTVDNGQPLFKLIHPGRFFHQEIVDFAVGREHNVVCTAADMVFTWGSNRDGQLGLGNKLDYSVPQALPWTFGPVTSMSCGGDHTVVVTALHGVVSWGQNEFGQCGRHEIWDMSYSEFLNMSPETTGNLKLISYPPAFNGLNNLNAHVVTVKFLHPGLVLPFEPMADRAETVSCSRSSTAVLTAAGRVYVCGSNHHGELTLQAPAVHDWSNLHCLQFHCIETCFGTDNSLREIWAGDNMFGGIGRDGRVYTWGSNSANCLGRETTATGGQLHVLGHGADLDDVSSSDEMEEFEDDVVPLLFSFVHRLHGTTFLTDFDAMPAAMPSVQVL
jgi:alpha-tubulin suppressor-like RCC1 family protein